MSRDVNTWFCDESGCSESIELESYPTGWLTRATDRGWYQVGHGFMNHRCPIHAPPWRAFDIANRAHEKAREVEWDRARDAFEIAWLEAYEVDHPAPKMPGGRRMIKVGK